MTTSFTETRAGAISARTEYIDENGDKWYRVPPFGCWEREKDRIAYNERVRQYKEKRRALLNANRLSKGKRRKSPSEFNRASDRYSEYVKQDLDMSFGEWLKAKMYKREYTGW